MTRWIRNLLIVLLVTPVLSGCVFVRREEKVFVKPNWQRADLHKQPVLTAAEAQD